MKKFLIGIFTLLFFFTITAPELANAATIKMNKTTLTLKEGETFQLAVKGAVGKITWKSNDSLIAVVTDKGLVEGVSEGTTSITATVNKKRYRCSITVEHVPTPEEIASANFTIDSCETARGILALITNNNDMNVGANVVIEFYDKDGNTIKTLNKQITVSEVNKQMAIAFEVNEDGYRFPYASYQIKVEAKLPVNQPFISYMNQIIVDATSFPNDHEVNIDVTNKAEDTIIGICFTVVFYKDGKIVDAVQQDIANIAKDEKKTCYVITHTEFREIKKELINYDAYKVFINEAFIN